MSSTPLYYINAQHRTIRFVPSFNNPLDTYYVIIRNYKKLYFGFSFNQPIILTKHLELFAISSLFNYPFDTTKNLITLILDYSFNQYIVLNKNICDLTFGFGYNKSLELTKNVRKLSFGVYFNHGLKLSKNLTSIVFGNSYSHPIVLTKCLRNVVMGYNPKTNALSNKIILTPNVLCLDAGIGYSHIHIEKPLHTLTICFDNHHIIDNLPQGIKNIVLDGDFNLPLDNLPNDVIHVEICNYNYSHRIPKFF